MQNIETYFQIRTDSGIPNYSQLKKYYTLIDDLQRHECIGEVIDPTDDFQVLGVSTSNVRPVAAGTWFLLHYLSVQELSREMQSLTCFQAIMRILGLLFQSCKNFQNHIGLKCNILNHKSWRMKLKEANTQFLE